MIVSASKMGPRPLASPLQIRAEFDEIWARLGRVGLQVGLGGLNSNALGDTLLLELPVLDLPESE